MVEAVRISTLNPIARKKTRQITDELAVRDLPRARDQ